MIRASVAAKTNLRPTPQATLSCVLRELGIQDWLVLAYLVELNIGVLLGQRGANFSANLSRTVGLLVFSILGLWGCRSGLLRDGWFKALLYRLAIYAPVQLSYFFFRDLLPSINPNSLDQELRALDMAIFGFEPAMMMDRWVTPLTTEWFSFFYFGYFFVLAVHVVPILFGVRNPRLLGEFTLGILAVFCVGHTGYLLVPGFGPYHAMAAEFQTQFPHGLWLDVVMDTVRSGGALKDIFPSLHTAAPCFITIFSFRHRARAPFRFTWPLVGFFSLNIIVATMFLRWHYLIDVVFGLLLASFTMWIVPRAVDFELGRRRALGLGQSWPDFHL